MLKAPFKNSYTYPGHGGVDYPQPLGTPFRASAPGRVLRLTRNAAGGNWIVVEYDAYPGIEIGYCHMRSHKGCPAAGSRVKEGTILGYVGDMGTRVTGPHLHVEILSGPVTHYDSATWHYFSKTDYVGGNVSVNVGVPGIAYQQRFLNDWREAKLKVDDADGPKTRSAVMAYQRYLTKQKLYSGAIDGVWGAGTQMGHIAHVDMRREQAKYKRTTSYNRAVLKLYRASK